MHRLIDFETAESGYSDIAAGATQQVAAPAEAGAAAASVPPPADDGGTGGAPSSGEGAAPAWTGPSQDEWQQYQERQAQLEQMLAEQPRTPQFDPYTGQPLDGGQAQPEMPEPWDPDYSQKMREYLDYRDQQTRAQMQPFLEPAVTEYAQREMVDSVERAAGAIGFDVKEVPQRADGVAAVAAALLNTPGMTAEGAYSAAAQFVSDLVKAEREAALNGYKASLSGGNGHVEPTAGGGAGLPAPAAAGSYAEIAELFANDPDRPQRAFG